MTEKKNGLFTAFHTDCDENSPLHDIADTDKVRDLSDEELIERYNTVTAMGAEIWSRLDSPGYALEAMFAELSTLDPDGTDMVPGKELRDAGLTHGQCAVLYDAIIRPYLLDVRDGLMEDIREYRTVLGRELGKRSLLRDGGHLWYNFGTEDECNWNDMGTLAERKDGWPQKGARDVCWYCGGRLSWAGDYPYDEVRGTGKGVVTRLVCSECGADIEYSQKDDEDEKI